MPKHPLYSIHGRNKRHGEINEQSNPHSHPWIDANHISRVRTQSGRSCNRTAGAFAGMDLLWRSAAMPRLGRLPHTATGEVDIVVIRPSRVVLGYIPPAPLRGAAQC